MFDTSQPSYKSFRGIVSERSRRIICWVGAGLSQPAGLPLWPDIRKQLTQAARRQANARSENRDRDLSQISSIDKIESHWTAFERLRDILGEPTYAAQIRESLIKSNDSVIPQHYRSIWNLPIRGIITLNLDRFAARAFGEIYPGKLLNEIDGGAAVGDYGPILQSNTPLVLNAHGVLSNRKSWVFTASEIQSLLANESYQLFINSLITTSVVLFIGVSADDVASGGFLSRLLQKGMSTGEHYWLTPRGDDSTKAWASASGIQPIYYDKTHGHDASVSSFFADLRQYRSKDIAAPPVIHNGDHFPIKPINESDAPNEIRKNLTALVESEGNSAPAIKRICSQHEMAIHKAWFVSTTEPNNLFFDYAVAEKIGEGGFGKVYRATDKDKNTVVLKVLRQEILENEELFGSFRRGVNSMRILSSHSVEGMVPYINAFELPPTVVMEFVDGPNLQELKEQGGISDILDVLRIALKIAEIVHRGHKLPERVLHRDLRPSNVMIRDYYTNRSVESVVVLDFDLSWHKGSTERSVDLNSVATMGYLAPELLQRGERASSRSTSVDVFGLSMTMFYMMAGQHPHVGIVHSPDWRNQVDNVVRKFIAQQTTWASFIARLSRLILSCTNTTQSKRLDMPSMIVELERLLLVLESSSSMRSAELLSEELAARASDWRDYEWDEASLACTVRLPSGVHLTLRPDDVSGEVHLRLAYTDMGKGERRNVSRYVADKRNEAVEKLRASGWKNIIEQKDPASLGVEARAEVASIASGIDGMAVALKELLSRFSME